TLEASASSGTLARPFLVCQASMLGLAANVWQLSLLLSIVFLAALGLCRALPVQQGGFVCLIPIDDGQLLGPCASIHLVEEGCVIVAHRAHADPTTNTSPGHSSKLPYVYASKTASRVGALKTRSLQRNSVSASAAVTRAVTSMDSGPKRSCKS